MIRILFYSVSFFFWVVDLYVLIPSAIAQIFLPNGELVVFMGIPTKEAKEEIEAHPVFA